MKIDDVLKLIDAGFTRADIMALATAQDPQPEQKDPQPEQKDPQPEQKDPQPDYKDDIETIKNQLAAMQAANINNDRQPNGANSQKTSDDVWKNFFEGVN